MLNKVVLMGRLTKDPELKYTPSNVAVVSFTVAVDRNYARQGEQRQTDFINVVGELRLSLLLNILQKVNFWHFAEVYRQEHGTTMKVKNIMLPKSLQMKFILLKAEEILLIIRLLFRNPMPPRLRK